MYRSALFLAAALGLAACADPHEHLSRDFGNAVSANMAAQIINPNPSMAGPSDMDGQRAGNAFDRYRTNKVYRPRLPIEGGTIYDTSQAPQQ